MFKFQSRVSKKGSYFFQGSFQEYENGVVETENEELAKTLRKNSEFVEMKEKKTKEEKGKKEKEERGGE